jgi:hypothetical protein
MAVIGALSIGSANAMPSSSSPAQLTAKAAFQSATLQHIDHRPGHYGRPNKGKRYGKHRFRPGSRHAHAPRGWHRHDRRPSYWQTRGCVVVGPVWFCP